MAAGSAQVPRLARRAPASAAKRVAAQSWSATSADTSASTSGVRVASLNLLALVPGAPELPLCVAQREDIIIVALRKGIVGLFFQLWQAAARRLRPGGEAD